jgi:cytochrome b561
MQSTTTTENPKRQNAARKNLMALHWVMAAFILVLYVTGIFVTHPLQNSVLAWLIPFLHQSVGILFLMLLIARILLLLRLIGQKYEKRSPKVNPNWLRVTILHSSLYFFMAIAPLSGFFLRNFMGADTTFFGIAVPPVFDANEDWMAIVKSSHFWSSYIFLAFIVLHILVFWKSTWINLKKRFNCLAKDIKSLLAKFKSQI